MKKQELLAPAGDVDAGYAALYYGADAVYLGLSKFSARATATNFDEATLDEFTAYAHHLGRKVYVAINTVVQEHELTDLIESLDICTRCHVDAIIIQDLGVARVIKKSYPWFEMHASTQMAVHNKEGALFLQKIGFKRVVLARELTLSEINEIAAIPDLETEVFIHGALCYSYSGLCQFSAMEYDRSANRGKCLYPCRAKFMCQNQENHLFSMKDLALCEDVLKMPDVTSLKIEGRKKSALYVAAVTDYYRHILDGKGADCHKEENIKQIFSRPWCRFHFNGRNKEIIDSDFVGHRGLMIGLTQGVFKKKLQFVTQHKISRHDGLQIDVQGYEKPFGFAVQKLYLNGKSVIEAQAGMKIAIDLPANYPHIQKGDKIYLSSSGAVKGAYHYDKPKPHEYHQLQDIDVDVFVDRDKIKAQCGEYVAEVNGDFQPTDNPNKSNEAITKAFNKTGETNFQLKKLRINNPLGLFTPLSLLNELRRRLYEQILIDLPQGSLPSKPKSQNRGTTGNFAVKVDNLNYLRDVNISKLEEVIYLISPDSDIKGLKEFPKSKIRIALPVVCRRPELYQNIIARLLEQGYNKWEVANYWGLEVLPIERLDVHFDASIYALNTQAIAMASEIGCSGVTLSIEDTKSNIKELIEKSNIATSLVIYQDVPLFISAGCIRKNDCKNCSRKDLWFVLKHDGKSYKALSRQCQMMVFDDRSFSIADAAQDLAPNIYRIDFVYCSYTAEQAADILNKMINFINLSDCISGNFLKSNI